MMFSGILLTVVTTALLHRADSNLVCLFDNSVPDPSQVSTVARCGVHEACAMEQYILPSGQVRHNLRCLDKKQCGTVSSSINTVICSECCDTDLCAASLCKNQGLPSGKICFHCDHPVKTPHSCEHIKLCGVDEACHTSQLPTSEYEIKCKPKASCATTASQPNLCTTCCSGNLCNDRCGYASNQPACVDDSICLGLKQNFHNNGRDVCTDPTFKKFCNSTCGLCQLTVPPTTTVMTSPVTQANPCVPDPCKNGICSLQGSTGYHCTCNTGYIGTNCDKVDPCQNNNPCQHGHCSLTSTGSAQCTCFVGFSGSHCDIGATTAAPANPCLPDPCHHGICSLQGNTGHQCTCTIGYIGTNCDIADPCHSSNPCMHGHCSINSTGSAQCTCYVGYSGTHCDIDSACHPSPCKYGTCSSQPGSTNYHCLCNTGYGGTNCDILTSPCSPNPCVNGQCTSQGSNFNCQCNVGYTGSHCHIKIRDCKDVLDNQVPSPSGDYIYTIKIGQAQENVRCDMSTAGGGWTVIMNREHPDLNFMRDSTEYALGFGSSRKDFWLGLEDMHGLTSDGRKYQLRIELTRADGRHYYEVYDDFSIGPRPDFILHIGQARGTAGDSLRNHNGYGFTTTDIDRDSNKLANCANYLQGAWWFYDCYDSCLTCPYVTPGVNQCRSMSWNGVKYCEALQSARMLVRPM